jgi:amino acid adenylation domain-containing protein
MLPRHPERFSPAGRDRARGDSATSGVPEELDQSPGAGFTTGKCIHELFEAQVERSPEAAAVIDENVRLTYGELNGRANRLAHRLRELGVGPDTLAGICLARTERMLVAILAVLKAGGAYVPVDPGYPKERIDFILGDAKVPVFITESALESIRPPEGTHVILLDPGWEETASARDDNPSSGVKPAHVAYVIYTSGSTGKPKGVAIEHRNSVALISWAREVFTPDELAGVLASTSICFDLSVFEMFVPLSWGGAAIVAENALALLGLPMRNEVTLVNTVPSAIRELVRMKGVPASVRVINLAGEPLVTALVDEIHAGTNAEKVYDLYGPSETTTYSTFALRKPGEPATIGRAIANEKILLLDADGRPVAAGEAGEIYIGGAGVARGYLNRPELTAERFVPDQSEPGGRLYRTGDLARWRPDGNLEFLGRMDFQVKIRGFRIEPGEIEVVLRQHPGIRDVAVVAREHGGGEEKRLVAYIVGEAEAGELRRFLRSKLPDYMTPAAFVFLDALPLSANGKLDRKALPAPDYASAHGVIVPRTPLEQRLARAWQEILGVESVGVLDNFFELGGHSLLAIRLVSRLREEITLELPLREVFESRNLEALAARIEAIQAAGGQEAAPGIRPVPRGENLLLSFAQQRLWFLDQIAPGSSAYNIPQNLRLSGDLNIVALEKAIGEIVRRHEALRTVFAYENENPVQIILPAKPFSLPIVDASCEEEARRLAREEALRPFDLRNGPLIRGTVVRVAADEHLLLLTLHHIVSDGWSMGVLARELSALYGAFSKGELSPLPELPVQYADFAAWQRNLMGGDRLERQLSYWKEQLAGARLGIDLPVDHPPSAESSHRADVVRFNYPESLTRGLIALSHRTGATLYMTLLGAFEVLLHRLTGQADLVIGTALAGRNQAETEGMIGFFVNTLPVRADLAGDPPFDQYLGRVRESTLGMFGHQDLPFEKLVQELNPERNTSHSPLFPVLFTMDDGLDARSELPGLRTTPCRADCVDAQFDLTVTFAECDGKLEGWLIYDTDLFERETIERIAGQLRRLMEGIVAAPGQAISRLPFLAEGESMAIPAGSKAAPEPASRVNDGIVPGTELQETLAKIWREVLGVKSVDAQDNFFELGGHSLLAIRLVSRLREELALEVPLRAVFENQTIESLATRIEALRAASGRQAALLPPIPRAPRNGNPPVSFAQQRLWFLDQLSPGSSAYNIPQAFRLRGELNRPALERAIGEIVRRHEVLRSVFAYEDDRPVQVILPPASFTLPLSDLSATPVASREGELRRLAREEAFQPFDLKKGPLMRASLLRLGPSEHVLLLTLHHIVSDGWSMSVMARELSQLYGAFSNGLPMPLSELPVQYADFAIWQRNWLQGEQLDRQLAYWKEQLRGDLPPLNLPTDYPRPEIPEDLAGNQSRTISRELSDKLKALCQQEGVTLFMLLLAAFDVLLHRLAGGEDIVVGSPIAGRNSPETESLVGFFVNTLVLRADLSGDPAFRELVARVRDVTLGAYTHQDVPFEKLVEELNPDRRLGHTPLFQVMLNMLSVEIDPLELNGFTVEVIPSAQFQTKFDLTLYVTDTGNGFDFNMVYNAGLFSEARMGEMLAQFDLLLAQVAARPEMRLSEISLLTDGAKAVIPDPERPLALVEYESVTEHFSRLAARAGGKVALAGPTGAWTYAALEAVTNQAAHFLCARGIRQQDVVAIWTGRHPSLAIAMLAAWKAGAAFVILDPALPPARLLEYLQIARPKGWIDYAGAPALPPALLGFTSSLPCRLTIPAGRSDAPIEALRESSRQPVERHAGSDDLAYIVFTSGSTGHPKAIAGSQRPIAHFLQWHCARFGFEESDRFSVLSGLGHDPLLRDILAPLWVGATACFPEPDVFDRPDQLSAWMKDANITVAHLTPAMATVLTESAEPGSLPSLRRIFCGGDVLRAGTVHQLRAVAPSALSVNFYGATETPQAIACYEVPRELPPAIAALPIGQGIDAVQLLILTPSGQLGGIGESGEICVRTPYLAKGYLNDPALSTARFVASPFTRLPGDSLYKTGDIGSYLPDGNVEFLGRSDAQVKVRGYRIETGEVETILLTHPGVRQAAVTAGEQPGGETCLVAHVASVKGAAIDTAALREFLRQRVPEYMIPSAFLLLDALPLLPNGKIDRKALPAHDQSGPNSDKVFMAPRNELELRLVRIWEEVLGKRGIGVRSDFFDLGGHSLLGVRLLARIEKVFDKRLPLSAIFQARNIEQLSAVLRKEGWLSSWYSLVPIQPCGSRPPLFGIHDLHYKDLAARLGIEQPIYGLRYGLAAHTRDGVAILPPRIEDLAAHYIQEMRALQPEGPYHLMGLSFGGIVAFEMAQQLHAQRQEVALLALFDSNLSRQEHRLPLPEVLSNLAVLGPSAVLNRVKQRAVRLSAKFRKTAYEPHVHHPWGVQRDLADTYRPKTYPGRVLLFKAVRQMPTLFHRFDPPEVGWQKWAAGGVELHEVSAGHIDLLEEPHVENVAAMMKRALDG